MSRFVVGVDGGGTRTAAVALSLEGQVLGRDVGRPALLEPSNTDEVARAIHHAAERAAAHAGLTLPAAVLHAGVAGAGRDDLRRALLVALVDARVAERVEVGTDIAAAAMDALGDAPGIVLLSGTGSIAWGRGPDGTEGRVGGWGALLGDEGSGYRLGLAGLRAVVRARDGRGPGTALTGALLSATGVEAPEDLVSWALTATKGRIAELAPAVLQLVGSDTVADEIVADGARDLAQHATVLAERLSPWPPGTPAVHLAGGALSPGSSLRSRVTSILRGEGLAVADRPVDGARGAGKLALVALDALHSE